MKIYNKPDFYFGVIFSPISIFFFVETLTDPLPDTRRQIALLSYIFLLLLFCIGSIFHGLSARFAKDMIETEETSNLLCKTKAKLMDLMIIGMAFFIAISIIGYEITDDALWLLPGLQPIAFFMIYWLGEPFVMRYYDKKQNQSHPDTENKP